MIGLTFLLLAAATPSAEALRLGREIADHGTLASLLPLIEAKETAELASEDRSLTADDQARLQTIARQHFLAGRERLLNEMASAYAKRLGITDLRAIAAFQRSPAARRQRQAMPATIASTMQAMGSIDFKGEVRAAMCKQRAKLCPKP